MIKVNKDLTDIPNSLNERKTQKRRDSCIRDGKYHQKKEFHRRFKESDIKEKLKSIYNDKCALNFINNAKKRNRLNKSYQDILDNLKKNFMDENSEFRALKFWILKNHKALIEKN